MSNRGGGNHPSTIKFGNVTKGNPVGRGGSTNPSTIKMGPSSLGTQATNPVSKTGKPTGDMGPC